MLLKDYVPIFCIMSLLLGCGSSSTDDSSAVEGDNSAVEDDTPAQEEAPNELTGTWKRCQNGVDVDLDLDNSDKTYSLLRKYVFTNNNVSLVQTVYSGANCQTKTQDYNLTFSYRINNEKNPKEIDLTITSTSQTYYTEDSVNESNQRCTEPLFSINKEITGDDIERICPQLFEELDLPKIGQIMYLIYKIENNNLFFNTIDFDAEDVLVTDPNKRPQTIDDTVFYSKQ